MTSRQPPALATRLLHWMGIAEQNPPLAGDLLEEFQSGRSAAWYWRQTFMAIAAGMYRGLRVHQRYFSALSLGYAAQAGVALVLRSHSWPDRLHGVPVIFAGVLSGVCIGAILWLGSRLPTPSRGAKDRMNDDGEASRYETVSVGLIVAATNFLVYLGMYCLAGLLLPRQSLTIWAIVEALWFVSIIESDLRRLRS